MHFDTEFKPAGNSLAICVTFLNLHVPVNIQINPLRGIMAHFNILLWLMPDDFTYQKEEPCPLMSQ